MRRSIFPTKSTGNFAAGVVACAVVFSFSGCKKKAAAGGPPPGFATQVIAVRAERQPVTESLALVGTVQANEAVEIKAQIGGIVEKIHFEEGQRVEEGALLFEIDSAKLAAQLAQAEAALRLSKSKYDRAVDLSQSKSMSQQELDEARASFDGAQASGELIRQQIKDTKIKAPFAGIMGARMVSPGQVVAPQQTLGSLVDLDPVKAEGQVPERFAGQLQTGQKFALKIAAFPNETFDGEVYFIAPQVDPINRTSLVKAKVPNPDLRLKPGMFASADVTLKVREEAVVIPEAALILNGEETTIFIVDGEMKAQPRPVRVGLRQAGRVEIIEGLKGGEMVIVEGTQKVRPGGKVKYAPADKAAPYAAAK